MAPTTKEEEEKVVRYLTAVITIEHRVKDDVEVGEENFVDLVGHVVGLVESTYVDNVSVEFKQQDS